LELLKKVNEDGIEPSSKKTRRSVKPLEGEVIRSNKRVTEDSKYVGKTKPTSTPPATIEKSSSSVPISSNKKSVERENVETGFRIYNKFDQYQGDIEKSSRIETGPRAAVIVPPTSTAAPVDLKKLNANQNFDGDKYLSRLESLHSIFMPDYQDLYEKLAKNPFDDDLLKSSFEERTKRKNYRQNRKAFDEILPYATAIKFVYQEDIGRFMLKINDSRIKHVIPSSQICYVLGYEENKPIKNMDIARYSPDLRGGCSHVCVYIGGGLLEQMIVGDKLASLLQIVAVTGKPGDIIEKKYDSPVFSKVIAKEIQEIEVELRNLEGRLIPFDYGAVICTLIFKKTIVF